MNRYKTGLFGYQGEFFKIKDFFDFVRLGESRGDLIDTVYLNPPVEVSVQGGIYLISEYKDYIISDLHYLVLSGAPLEAPDDSKKTTISLATEDFQKEDFQEESPYIKIKETIASGNTKVGLESLSLAASQINKCLAFLLRAEIIKRSEVLISLSEMLKEKRFNEILEKVAEESQVEAGDLEEYLLKSIDEEASELNSGVLLETAEYRIQSPFSNIFGIYNKKTGKVKLLTPDSVSFDWDDWGDCFGRDLWDKAESEEFTKKALAFTSVEILIRSILNLKLSLYNLGLNVDGTKAFFLKRFFGKKILRKALKNPL